MPDIIAHGLDRPHAGLHRATHAWCSISDADLLQSASLPQDWQVPVSPESKLQ
jgi:hypothetical protein